MRQILLLAPLALLVACPKPVPPELPKPEPTISAQVTVFPENAEVMYQGEKIVTPGRLKVFSIKDLANGFSAANMPGGAVEHRIRALTDGDYEVTLVFDQSKSKMAAALGLSKILVFDYCEEINFDFDKSQLKPTSKELIAKQANVIKEYFSGLDIIICGHSDSVGRRQHNEELSLDRALSVKEELVKLGIPGSSIKTQGFGSEFPIVSNDTEAGRARNRRIEIILGN
jgi:outer membrane protein OmpA-like peptidoglycan-associated protein